MDFRGDESQNTFSYMEVISKIAGFPKVKSYVEKNINDYVFADILFDKMAQKKEYLELQAYNNNGYKPLNKNTLKSRWL